MGSGAAIPVAATIWLVCVFLTQLHVSGAALRAGPGPYFKDADDRVVLLRGLNVAGDARLPPFTPIKDLRTMNVFQTWGVNVVRLVFIWEAYEPQKGSYNAGYLKYIDGVVQYLHNLGISTVIEMHQDGYSRWLNSGCGSGFPKWAINPILMLYPPNWFPNEEGKCPFPFDVSHGVDLSSNAAWLNFMSNWGGVRDAFLDVWERLAKHFADVPGVIGYDIVNEPAASGSSLTLLYNDAAKRIRAHHKDALLLVSASLFTWQGAPIDMQKPNFDNFALSVHYYNQNDSALPQAFDNFAAKAEEWNVPLFVGEFAFSAVNERTTVTMVGALATSFYDRFDRLFLGWTQWAWSANYHETRADGFSGSDFSVTDEFHNHRANYIIRPAPRAIAGTPVRFKVDDYEKTLELAWEVTDEAVQAKATTDIFAPLQRFFQVPAYEWLNVTISGPADMACAYSYASLIISCRPSTKGLYAFRAARAYNAV